MMSVTVGGPGLVAVGLDESSGDKDAAVWTSPDGITWSRVPHDDAVFGGEDEQLMVSDWNFGARTAGRSHPEFLGRRCRPVFMAR